MNDNRISVTPRFVPLLRRNVSSTWDKCTSLDIHVKLPIVYSQAFFVWYNGEIIHTDSSNIYKQCSLF